MIVDRLENISRYALMIKECAQLDKFFQEHTLKQLQPGRYHPENTKLADIPVDFLKVQGVAIWVFKKIG